VKLKCVGGPSDGRMIDVADEALSVVVFDPIDPSSYLAGWEGVGDAVVEQPHTIYVRRTFNEYHDSKDGREHRRAVFLTPHDVSMLDVLCRAVGVEWSIVTERPRVAPRSTG
jgi:hypothetical protein